MPSGGVLSTGRPSALRPVSSGGFSSKGSGEQSDFVTSPGGSYREANGQLGLPAAQVPLGYPPRVRVARQPLLGGRPLSDDPGSSGSSDGAAAFAGASVRYLSVPHTFVR